MTNCKLTKKELDIAKRVMSHWGDRSFRPQEIYQGVAAIPNSRKQP